MADDPVDILLVEDSPDDIELTLRTLDKHLVATAHRSRPRRSRGPRLFVLHRSARRAIDRIEAAAGAAGSEAAEGERLGGAAGDQIRSAHAEPFPSSC